MKAPHDVNSIAVVDRKIQSIKKAISGAMMEETMGTVNVEVATCKAPSACERC